jgi:hypothetical protein
MVLWLVFWVLATIAYLVAQAPIVALGLVVGGFALCVGIAAARDQEEDATPATVAVAPGPRDERAELRARATTKAERIEAARLAGVPGWCEGYELDGRGGVTWRGDGSDAT